MKRLYKQVEQGWELVEEANEVIVPIDGIYRIEELVEGGSIIIFETEVTI